MIGSMLKALFNDIAPKFVQRQVNNFIDARVDNAVFFFIEAELKHVTHYVVAVNVTSKFEKPFKNFL